MTTGVLGRPGEWCFRKRWIVVGAWLAVFVRVADELGSRFGQQVNPALTVVARTSPANLDAWAKRWANDVGVKEIGPVEKVTDDLSTVGITVKGSDSQSTEAQALVDRIRADRPPGERSWVTGDAAALIDLKTMIINRAPGAIALTVILVFILMFAMTGSLVVPIKALLANVVSLGATVGILYLIFQKGFLSGGARHGPGQRP